MTIDFRKSSLALALAAVLLGAAGGSFAQDAGTAKNVIFFLGDGMGPVTVTAARIYKGEKALANGADLESPERAKLALQELGYAGRVKTYSNDGQTTDSAPSMAAYMTGVKMNNEVISMTAETQAYAPDGNQYINGENTTCPAGNGQAAETLLELSIDKGRSTGVVSTTRLGHATPAATYAHVCNRNAYNTIAEQSVPGYPEFNSRLKGGLDVMLGGGWRNYLPKSVYASSRRTDERNLVEDLQKLGYTYVDSGTALNSLDVANTSKLLGIFASSEMAYELDRTKPELKLDQPSLAEMTEKALEVVSRNEKGFFLMVEGGRIDHALHGTNAKRALEDTLALDAAVEKALEIMEQKDPGLANTLIVVTADHDHAIAFNGYTKIGNPILGLARGYSDGKILSAADGKPYTTLVFGNGGRASAGAVGEDGQAYISPARSAERENLTNVDTTADNFLQEVGINLGGAGSETHGGGDVMLFAGGAGAQHFKGSYDNTKVFNKVRAAAGL
ncbi:alkaline phosphatase [Corticibacter populi]|uniref:Alkaline phosphatase n=1 Tax=Corticibacter populi TaxID=1550736 RepID=A0A3M6QTV6_9BURK|nr:alkaline phosphatase [Corticibacter populi]RMX05979.1 alkaline phosphatase [Corticibacter populi]RZS30690.1 alkaline phosphatase [Corticibacter populi]